MCRNIRIRERQTHRQTDRQAGRQTETDRNRDTERVGVREGNERWEREECGDEEKAHSVLVMVRSRLDPFYYFVEKLEMSQIHTL